MELGLRYELGDGTESLFKLNKKLKQFSLFDSN